MKKVAMIGVGKLGQDCGEVMADSGYEVVGYDIEPRLPKFPMKDSIQEAVKDRDIIFIAAPTPHDPIYGGETPTSHLPNKDFDYTIVKNILTEVNKYANKNQLVVLISTVLPGTVRTQLEPCITNARFIYNPYLIAMGTIKWDMVNPEMVIIGTEDGSVTGDAKELIDFYKVFMQNDPRYEVGTWDEAESIKIFYNTFISTKLALVNMIQDVAETNGNINVDVVTNALKKSTYRIMGPAYMTAAFGDAGACHPRDNIALRWLADRLNLKYDLFDSIMHAREIQAERMALRCLENGRNVTIIGKAYKPSVPYTNGSASMLVGYYIEKHGGNLNYYDPNTDDLNLREDWTQVYLIGYWESWVEQLVFKDPGAVVIDPWRKIKPNQHSGEIIHYGDTRKKHRYTVPESTIENMRTQMFEMFPELKKHDQSIHLVDSTINMDTTFVLRPTEDIVKELKNAKTLGKSKFMFFACTEAFMPHVISKIQRLATILEDTIDEQDFIVLTATPDGDDVYAKLKQKHVWTKNLSMLNCNFFYYITTTYARGFEYIGGYDLRDKGKLFTCFNKLNREHRMLLVDKMLANGLVDKSYYSFEGDETFAQKISKLSDKYSNIKLFKDRFPIRLNITPQRHNPVEIRSDDLIYYKDSYFSVITETLFFDEKYPNQHHRPFVEDSMFLTEKTYRCFALLHPFILMARPHSLAQLRKQGFKTFAPYIDESYDSIENDDRRFDAIVREISRLCKFDGPNWTVWQEGIKEITEYNQKIFHENRNFSFTEDYMSMFSGVPVTTTVLKETKKLEKDSPIISTPAPAAELISTQSTPSTDPVKIESTTVLSNNFQKQNDLNTEHLDWRNKRVTYENGIVLNFPNHVDGGGFEIKDEMFDLIDSTGKAHYSRAFEWCAGPGQYGFDLLDKNKADHVVFSDCYRIAIDTCVANAKENNIESKISVYAIDKISKLLPSEKFDLVVANPPHSDTAVNLENSSGLSNSIRIIVDEDYEAHQEFFANIKRYLTPDADVYITAGSQMNKFIQWAAEGGLFFIGFRPTTLMSGGIYHFKAQF